MESKARTGMSVGTQLNVLMIVATVIPAAAIFGLGEVSPTVIHH